MERGSKCLKKLLNKSSISPKAVVSADMVTIAVVAVVAEEVMAIIVTVAAVVAVGIGVLQ